MKNSKYRLLSVMFVVSSFFVLLGVSFFGTAFDQDRYASAFSRYSVQEKTPFDADAVSAEVVAYVTGGAALASTVFTDREVYHLCDVRNVVASGKRFLLFQGALFFISVSMVFFVDRRLTFLSSQLVVAGLVSLGIAIAMLLSMIFSFEAFFSWFHSLFFAAGSWQFPTTSNLILLYPKAFFVELGIAFMKRFVLGANFFIGLGVLLILKRKWQR